VPDTFKLSMNIGLDVKTWLKKDLVDILIAGGGYAPFTLDVNEFVEAGHAHGVPVYPCMSQGTSTKMSKGAITEVIRAMAANWYQAGADGIYLWNLASVLENFEWMTADDPEVVELREKYYACLADIGDPAELAGKDKLFCVDGDVYQPYRHVSNEPPLPVARRMASTPWGVLPNVPFVVGDDVEAASARGALGQAKLTIEVKNLARADALSFRLNGMDLQGAELAVTDAATSAYDVHYVLAVPPLKTGRNVLEGDVQQNGVTPGTPMQVDAVRLKLEYKEVAEKKMMTEK
jgi:hypothetical protein